MNDARLVVTLDHNRQGYRPGDVLTGTYAFAQVASRDVLALEISVLWYTEGKGDEDLAVHYFKRFSTSDGDYLDPYAPGRFSTLLPQSPLSYEGVIVKIRWCARARLFLAGGRELTAECPFQLGQIPPARAVLPTPG